MDTFTLPPDYSRIRRVGTFRELVTTPFSDGVNALCWIRSLTGDFREVVERLDSREDVARVDDTTLAAFPWTAAGRIAVDTVIGDLRGLRAHGLSPVLDCIRQYPRDEPGRAVSTDVYSFHADSAPVPAETFLCTYHGAASEGLRNDEATRWVDLPSIRARLLEEFGGRDGDEFREFLTEACYDLHYAPAREARPFSFGLGNLWRIAVDYPGCPVPPCLHRAPASLPGAAPRLLLIS